LDCVEFEASLDPDAKVHLRFEGPKTPKEYFGLCDQDQSICRRLVKGEDRKSKAARCYYIDQQCQGRVFIDLTRMNAIKKIENLSEFGILNREVYWLKELSNSESIPQLIDFGSGWIETAYVGEPLRCHNVPSDWKHQAEQILSDLHCAGCSHNDIKCDNITVFRGKMHLIDFGWATIKGQAIPECWPEGIGRQHRIRIHKFDDRVAIYSAIESAIFDRIDHSRMVKY
jgi:predicted Ser/Thr protein kinase